MSEGTESLFPLLDRSDVSHDKLVELERRLVGATKACTVPWERDGNGYSWASPKGVVDVSPAGVTIYDDSGNRLRRFRYPTSDLYEAADAWFDGMASALIERILSDLDALVVTE